MFLQSYILGPEFFLKLYLSEIKEGRVILKAGPGNMFWACLSVTVGWIRKAAVAQRKCVI